MRRAHWFAVACIFVLGASTRALAAPICDSGVCATITAERVVLENDLVERSWARSAFVTESLVDKRTGTTWSSGSADFVVRTFAAEISSSLLGVADVTVTPLARGGLRVTFELRPLSSTLPPPLDPLAGFVAERIVEAYPGVAGFRSQTTITTALPLVVSGYDVETIVPPTPVAATNHSFRAGGDWREPGWQSPALTVGDPHGGSWRVSYPASRVAGASVGGTAQWMSLADASG
ncbi:MAG: hypothetical protein ACREQ9_14935, partial [Candidatus Binatia bacterium]